MIGGKVSKNPKKKSWALKEKKDPIDSGRVILERSKKKLAQLTDITSYSTQAKINMGVNDSAQR